MSEEGLSYFHGPLAKDAAEELILGDDGASTSGKFLIRSKGKSNDEFILSVIYKKSATHHTVAREGAGEEFKVNKQPSDGATTLEAVVAFLRNKNPKWPVPLTEAVSADGGGGDEPAAAAPSSSSGAGALDTPFFSWSDQKRRF